MIIFYLNNFELNRVIFSVTESMSESEQTENVPPVEQETESSSGSNEKQPTVDENKQINSTSGNEGKLFVGGLAKITTVESLKNYFET